MKRSLFKRITLGLILFACLCFMTGGGFSYALEEPQESEAATDEAAATEVTATEDTATEEMKPAFDIEAAEDSPAWVVDLAATKEAEASAEAEEAQDVTQLFVVAVTGRTVADVSMHQKDAEGTWKQILETTGYIGRNGLGKTKEGDGRTPIGTYRFTQAFGIAEDPGCLAGYYQVTKDDYWSGDQRKGYRYNEMISIKDYPDLNKSASEHLIDYNPHYQYCLNFSWNEDCTPGKGSAIFLHCLGYNPYTAGCIAIPEKEMVKVLQNVHSDCVVVIDYMEMINQENEESDQGNEENDQENEE